MTSAKAPEDGRRKRSRTSRDSIVAAMLSLVEEGAITPSAEQVAARAQVGLRTVFRHFKDMESLYAAMTLVLARQYEDWLAPFAAQDWNGQLIEAVERRIATYERLLPFRRAGDAHRHISPAIQEENNRMLALMRARLVSLVPETLSENSTVFELLDLVTSFAAWQRLRGEQQLSFEQARAVVMAYVTRLRG